MKEITTKLVTIQKNLVAPKNQRNTFGNYNYRSAEDILEALKPLLEEQGCILTISDDIIIVGDRIYVKATAKISDGTDTIETSAMAREPLTKKGMDEAQITGATSSYARKYALNGLFAIDDTKDADATNRHEKEEITKKQPYNEEVKWYNDVDKNIDNWTNLVNSGKMKTEAIIAKIEGEGYKLSKINKDKILNLGK